MLESLKHHSPRERERILSRVVLSLMPDPELDPQSTISVENQLIHQRILEEIQPSGTANKLGLFQRLSREISIATFSQVRKDDVKARLGQKGLLRQDLYKIELSEGFKKGTTRFGISLTDAEEALRRPEAVEHLLPDHFDQSGNQPSFTLILKTPRVKRRNDAFTLLVLSKREGTVQTVLAAWRVYHSDINISAPLRPLGVLIAFADRYGFPITVGSKTANFILYEKISVKGALSEMIKGPSGIKMSLNQFTQQIQFSVDPGVSLNCQTHLFVRVTKSPPIQIDGTVLEVALAFIVDLERYAADLRRHGVAIRLSRNS